jgi:hypothetical protein
MDPQVDSPQKDTKSRRVSRKSDSSSVVSQEEHDKLRKKYDNLKALRQTEPEAMYEDLRKTSQAREEGIHTSHYIAHPIIIACNKMIEQLKQEKERLQVALDQKRHSNGSSDSDRTKEFYSLQLKGNYHI